MRIGIFDPYLDSLGGGERYILTIASHLSDKHKVELFWDDESIIKIAEEKLDIDLSSIQIVHNIFSKDTSFLKKTINAKKYDCLIFLSDGSIPFLFAKKNILIFQFPVNWVKGTTLLNKIKLSQIDKIICYTNFVKKYLDKTFQIRSRVLYPPVVSSNAVKKIPKENIILSVGRFTKAMNMKKQEVLVDTFIKLYKGGLRNWKLVLVGSYLPADEDFVKEITKNSKGYPIEIVTNASYAQLTQYYQKAKIYWHAAGFGEDLDLHPERAEHFGISTVEAMGEGVVPVVINAGGQPEIVENEVNGFLWNTIEQLEKNTMALIKNSSLMHKISAAAIVRAGEFSKENFYEELDSLMVEKAT